MQDYHIDLFYSSDDGGCIADIPDLKLCSAFGETPGEALQEVLRAKMLGWLPPAMPTRQFLAPVTAPRFIRHCVESPKITP